MLVVIFGYFSIFSFLFFSFSPHIHTYRRVGIWLSTCNLNANCLELQCHLSFFYKSLGVSMWLACCVLICVWTGLRYEVTWTRWASAEPTIWWRVLSHFQPVRGGYGGMNEIHGYCMVNLNPNTPYPHCTRSPGTQFYLHVKHTISSIHNKPPVLGD